MYPVSKARQPRNRQATRLAFLFSFAFCVWAGGLNSSHAQNPLARITATEPVSAVETNVSSKAGATDSAASNALEERLAKARADLAVTVALDKHTVDDQPPGVALKDLALRRGLHERLVRLYEQQIGYTAELEAVKSRRAELANEAQSWTGFAEPRPHSILLTDALREGIQMERLEIANGESAVAMLTKLIEENRVLLSQADERIRQLNEKLEGDTRASDVAELALQREMERLRSQVSGATVGVLDLERQIRQEQLAGSRTRLGLFQQQLVTANAGASFTDADMAMVNERLAAEQRRWEIELTEAESRQRAASQALADAREKLRETQASSVADSAAIAIATEQFELRRAQSETADTTVNALRFMLQVSTTERTIWDLRFASYKSSNVETIRHTKKRLEQLSGLAETWKTYYQQRVENTSSQQARLEARLANLDDTSGMTPLIRERLAALHERDQVLLRVVRSVDRVLRLVQQLDEGLREAAGNLPFLGRMSNALSDTGSFLGGLWRLELFVAQDTITVDGQQITGKRSVTLGKVITAILILVVGYWLAGLVSALMEPIFIKRFKIEPNQASLIRRWLRVVLILGLTLFSLVSVKIPLTVFAFAGGALAIGLGFGLQTLLKNFVSGIIILFERPFRVGDVLDVAGQRGTVGSIGIRASVLQLWDGTETLIPNSALLENNLTNWTYSNRIVRFAVNVGVAYESDTRRVVQLLTEIADQHGLVEKKPKPQVLFTNFGESSLDFELRFWVDVIKANPAQVSSDLRQMITGTFAENRIAIAFPQRDLHLDTLKPLQVQIVPPTDRPPEHVEADKQQQTTIADKAEPKSSIVNQTKATTPSTKLP